MVARTEDVGGHPEGVAAKAKHLVSSQQQQPKQPQEVHETSHANPPLYHSMSSKGASSCPATESHTDVDHSDSEQAVHHLDTIPEPPLIPWRVTPKEEPQQQEETGRRRKRMLFGILLVSLPAVPGVGGGFDRCVCPEQPRPRKLIPVWWVCSLSKPVHCGMEKEGSSYSGPGKGTLEK